MIVRKYGLTLRRIRLQDIELVRQKRNSDEIRQVMQFREEITPEMQLKWFNSINNFNNFYYIVEYQGKQIGLINDKNMDWEARTSESGLFFWDKEYIHTFLPILASLVLLEMGFYYLDWNTSYIHVMMNNQQAADYVRQIGYEICDGQENVENRLFYLDRNNFEQKGRKIRRAAETFRDEESGDGYILLEPEDYESGLAMKIEAYFNRTGMQVNIEDSGAGRKYFR
jgi:RimJ/RimL family protein N-acetyltransferase